MCDCLVWDLDPQARALSPQSAHYIKTEGFAGLQTESLFFPRLFSFLLVRTGSLLL